MIQDLNGIFRVVLKYNAWGTTRYILLKYNARGNTRCSVTFLLVDIAGMWHFSCFPCAFVLMDIDIPIFYSQNSIA